ncbi:polysaccharide biosynthesis/export family protein [Roseivivax isoporae]|uniref:polysaccharide biosynthesis/export family protein n=1 Tax=Roseivivax isoporae TaxID=591206 RepID=UPI0005C1E54C|nr:polysaccharide biosynthesis/export family protein [Roseivivax isoporae]
MSRRPSAPRALALVAALAACGPQRAPENLELAGPGGSAYQAQYRDPPATRAAGGFLRAPEMNARTCRPPAGGAPGSGGKGSLPAVALRGLKLSPGDLLDVRVGEDETLTGAVEVRGDGAVTLPFLPPVQAAGRSEADVEASVIQALLDEELYTTAPRVSVRLQDLAAVRVGVSGAVFEPQPVTVGSVPGDQVDALRQMAIGSATEARNLSVALRAAGGVRPDADLSAVELRRAGRLYTLDLRPILDGQRGPDVMLIAGDEIRVPSRGCFDEDLMVVGPISPPGITLFLSNLTVPATGNAPSAVGREVREVPYGTRFLQAVIDTNCVGGIRGTSADRAAALLSRNPVTDVSIVVQRRVEDMLRRPDRDDYDPYLLPGDAIACYDSSITSLADIGRVLGILGGSALLVAQ